MFDKIWQSYIEVTPSAHKVHQLLGSGNDVINDHVAYRTFNIEKVNIEKLAAPLIALGYKDCGQYTFEAKKLNAKHFEHSDKTMPKVFISELLVEEFSEEVQTIIHQIVDQIDEKNIGTEEFLYSGTHWKISQEQYHTLVK